MGYENCLVEGCLRYAALYRPEVFLMIDNNYVLRNYRTKLTSPPELA